MINDLDFCGYDLCMKVISILVVFVIVSQYNFLVWRLKSRLPIPRWLIVVGLKENKRKRKNPH